MSVDQRINDGTARRVVPQDVARQADSADRRIDGGEHTGVGLVAVPQQGNRVTRHRPAPAQAESGAVERLEYRILISTGIGSPTNVQTQRLLWTEGSSSLRG